MNKKTLLIAVLFALALCACKKDKDDDDNDTLCSGVWTTEVADELNAVSAAAMAYATNPSHETCVAYKDAYQDYIDAMQKFSNCVALWTPQERENYEASLDEAEDNINSLCDE
jgi:hypothetical protein